MAEDMPTRVARLEGSRDEHRKSIEFLLPLPAEVAVIKERQANFGQDLTDGFKAIREELKEMREDSKARARERRAMVLALTICSVGLFGTFVMQLVGPLRTPAPAAQERTK